LFEVLNAELAELERRLDEAEEALASRDLSSRNEPAESDGAQ
jgi:hypothetical protein